MKFALSEDLPDKVTALRNIEQQAPKHIRSIIVDAAVELEQLYRVMTDAANELDAASELRVSAMDTTSRADEISRQMRQAMVSVVRQLRAKT